MRCAAPSRAVAVLMVLGAGLVGTGAARAERAALAPAELPLPVLELPVPVAPLGIGRPALTRWLPELPIPAPPPGEPEAWPLPRFASRAGKPAPAMPARGRFARAWALLGDRQGLLDRGLDFLADGDLAGAERDFRDAGEGAGPELQARAAFWLGEALFRQGRLEAAQREYARALGGPLPPEFRPYAALGAVWTALLRHDLAGAAQALREATATPAPESLGAVVRFLAGVYALLDGRPAEALRGWDGLGAGSLPGELELELLFWRGLAWTRLGRPEQALPLLDRFLAGAPREAPLRPDALVEAGWGALEGGRPPEEAIRRLEEVPVGTRPDLRLRVWAGLARAFLRLGDDIRARQEAGRLLSLVREPLARRTVLEVAEETVRRAGAAMEGRRALEEAARLFDGLRAAPPPVGEYAAYRLADLLERLGRLGEAQRLYERLRDGGRDEALAQRASYRLALLALAQRPAAARAEADQLLRSGLVPEPPEFREAVLLLAAEAAARAGDPGRAAGRFALVLREFPASPRVARTRLLLGWARLAEQDPAGAAREWRLVVQGGDPEAAPLAALALADLALRQGRDAEALEALRVFDRLAPGHALASRAAFTRGLLLVRTAGPGAGREAEGRLREAVGALQPLLAGARLDGPAQEALARRAVGLARYRLGEFEAAQGQFERAAQLQPLEPGHALGAGLAAFRRQRLAEAEGWLDRAALAASPEVAGPALYARVLVAVGRGDLEGFRERAAAYVERFPSRAESEPLLYELARQALGRGDLRAAEGWVRQLVRDFPRSAWAEPALLALGQAARGQPAVAREAYRTLLSRPGPSGSRVDARLGLAEAAAALGAWAEAREALQAALPELPAPDPRAARALLLLMQVHEREGRPEGVLAAAEQFLSRFPRDPLAPSIHLLRGRLLRGAGRADEARRSLEAARDAGEPAVAAPAHVALGDLHRDRGELEAAVAAYLGAAYLYPETPWAVQGLQGAAQSYLARQMVREAGVVLRKLADWPGVDPAVAGWARQALAQLGSAANAPDPGAAFRKAPPR